MKLRLSRALAVLAVGSAGFLVGTAANASTVTFASTVNFTLISPPSQLSFASTGLNGSLTVGTPDIISNFITVRVASGAWTASNVPITANFTFTVPTPNGTTTDSGTINGGQVNGSGANGTLTISWPNQPVEFDFADGTKLDVTLGGLNEFCDGNNCLAGTYSMSGTFDVLNARYLRHPFQFLKGRS